jgi:hypothetical protein
MGLRRLRRVDRRLELVEAGVELRPVVAVGLHVRLQAVEDALAATLVAAARRALRGGLESLDLLGG